MSEAVLDLGQGGYESCQPKETLAKENGDMGLVKIQPFLKCESSNSRAVHPVRTIEDENLDYDSNASSSSFEFHNERSVNSQHTRPFSRPMSSKWNDAEKWIMKRQNVQPNNLKKNNPQNQANRMPVTNMVRIAPESSSYDPKSLNNRVIDNKLVDFYQPASQIMFEKFSFNPPDSHSSSGQAYGGNALVDQFAQRTDLKEVDQRELSYTNSSGQDSAGTFVPLLMVSELFSF